MKKEKLLALLGEMDDEWILEAMQPAPGRRGRAASLDGMERIADEGRKALLNAWQTKKKEEITHPYLKEKIPWGLIPYVQALLLARHLRGDLEAYPPFLWK